MRYYVAVADLGCVSSVVVAETEEMLNVIFEEWFESEYDCWYENVAVDFDPDDYYAPDYDDDRDFFDDVKRLKEYRNEWAGYGDYVTRGPDDPPEVPEELIRDGFETAIDDVEIEGPMSVQQLNREVDLNGKEWAHLREKGWVETPL